jgi:hypothetical protein
MAAQKRKTNLSDLAETNKLLVPAGFPQVTRDYRMVLPGGELELFPDPKSIPTAEHATTDFQVMFFPDLGVPVDVTEFDDARWLVFLQQQIAKLKEG